MAGLIAKFLVRRVNQTPANIEKHKDCRYFVLDPQHDPTAYRALEFYADSTENDDLRIDILHWLRNTLEPTPDEPEPEPPEAAARLIAGVERNQPSFGIGDPQP